MQGPHLVRYSTHSLTRTTSHVLALANTQTNEHSRSLSQADSSGAGNEATKQRASNEASEAEYRAPEEQYGSRGEERQCPT